MSDFLLKNEKRRVHKCLDKSRKLTEVLQHPTGFMHALKTESRVAL